MKRIALAVALLIGLAVPAWADYLDGMVAKPSVAKIGHEPP